METFWLRLRAPFAAFRGFQAGVYRASSPVMPPSTAFGLILNLAGIEMRDKMNGPITLIRQDLPKLRIAIGLVDQALTNREQDDQDDQNQKDQWPTDQSIAAKTIGAQRSTLYQQLHSYPVGSSGKEFAERTKGAKYWIAPVRREILVDYDGVIGVQTSDSELLTRVADGLNGNLAIERYGLPFAGDNNLLFDRIDVVTKPPESTYWYSRIEPGEPARRGSCRLTVGIDRADNSKTTSYLFAPLNQPCAIPEDDRAWNWTPSPPVKQ